MHSAATLALLQAAVPSANKQPMSGKPRPANGATAAAKQQPQAPTSVNVNGRDAATTAAALRQASQLPLPKANAAPAGTAQPGAAPKPHTEPAHSSINAPAARQPRGAKQVRQQAAAQSSTGSADALSTPKPAAVKQCQPKAGASKLAQDVEDGELLLSPTSFAAARRSISPGLKPVRRSVPPPRPPPGPPPSNSSAMTTGSSSGGNNSNNHAAGSRGGGGSCGISRSRGGSPPTTEPAVVQGRSSSGSSSGSPPAASAPWLQPAALSPPAWLHNFLPPTGGWGVPVQLQPPPDLYHRGLHHCQPAGHVPPWQQLPTQYQLPQQPQHYLQHHYQQHQRQPQQRQPQQHQLQQYQYQPQQHSSRSSSPAGSQHSSPHTSPLQVHHYTGTKSKTPAATYQKQLHAAAGLDGKVSKSARKRQAKQRRKAAETAAAAARGAKQAGGKQRPQQPVATGSHGVTFRAMAPLTPKQAQAAVPSAKAAVDQIAAGIERLGISKAAGSGSNGGGAPSTASSSGSASKAAAGGAPLQLPAMRKSGAVVQLPGAQCWHMTIVTCPKSFRCWFQHNSMFTFTLASPMPHGDELDPAPQRCVSNAGGSDFLSLKEYKLMVEAGQLAPYKGSLPSADAKYAAGWAMKRCGCSPNFFVPCNGDV